MANESESRAGRYEVDIEEVEYLRHGDKSLLARVFKPRGKGPFHAVVEMHGGAWHMVHGQQQQQLPYQSACCQWRRGHRGTRFPLATSMPYGENIHRPGFCRWFLLYSFPSATQYVKRTTVD